MTAERATIIVTIISGLAKILMRKFIAINIGTINVPAAPPVLPPLGIFFLHLIMVSKELNVTAMMFITSIAVPVVTQSLMSPFTLLSTKRYSIRKPANKIILIK